MIKPSIHQYLLKEYALTSLSFSEQLKEKMKEYAALAGQISAEWETLPAVDLIKEEKATELAIEVLNRPQFSNLMGQQSLREMLTLGNQRFFAKGTTSTTYGLPTYSIWSDDRNYFHIPKQVYDVLNLPDKSVYAGDWMEAPKVSTAELQEQTDLLEKIDEQLTLRMVEELRSKISGHTVPTCVEDLLFSKPIAEAFYQNFTRLFDGFNLKNYNNIFLDERESGNRMYVLSVNKQWVKIKMVNEKERKEFEMTYLSNGKNKIYPTSFYQKNGQDKTISKSIFKNYSTCEFNDKHIVNEVVNYAKSTLHFNKNNEFNLFDLKTEFQKLKLELKN